MVECANKKAAILGPFFFKNNHKNAVTKSLLLFFFTLWASHRNDKQLCG